MRQGRCSALEGRTEQDRPPGHHYDDAVETFPRPLIFGGAALKLQPVTCLDCGGIARIRPLLSLRENLIRHKEALSGPACGENHCPANGNTKRQEIKELICELNGRYRGLKARAFGAMQRLPLHRSGARWSTAGGPCLNWRIYSKFDRRGTRSVWKPGGRGDIIGAALGIPKTSPFRVKYRTAGYNTEDNDTAGLPAWREEPIPMSEETVDSANPGKQLIRTVDGVDYQRNPPSRPTLITKGGPHGGRGASSTPGTGCRRETSSLPRRRRWPVPRAAPFPWRTSSPASWLSPSAAMSPRPP